MILKHLADCPHDHPGSNHVVKLLDHFVVRRRGKSYDGLVLEPVTLCLSEILDTSIIPEDEVRRATRQVSMGLAYMHQMNVSHGG